MMFLIIIIVMKTCSKAKSSLRKQLFLCAPCCWDVLQGGTSATQRQKFHTDDEKWLFSQAKQNFNCSSKVC